jgi:hypothetical protein
MEILLGFFVLGVLGLFGKVIESNRANPDLKVLKFFTIMMYSGGILFLLFLGLSIITE